MEFKLISNDVAQISGFPYLISRSGELWSLHEDKYLKPDVINSGYLRFTLYNKGKRKKMTAHRLVAMAFIPNPEDKPCINHIDADKTNNDVGNLEWCTHQENNDDCRHRNMSNEP